MKLKIDGTVVDTDNATETWCEACDWDGRNRISRATGSQWEHQTLYRSRRGRYYIVYRSDWQGTSPSGEFIDAMTAAKWLTFNDRELPEELLSYADECSE